MIKKNLLLLLIFVSSTSIGYTSDEVFLKCTYTEKPIYTKDFTSQFYNKQTGAKIYKFANNHIYTIDNKEIGDITDADVASAYFRYREGDFIVIESFSVNRKTGAFINERSIGTQKDLYVKLQGQGSCEKTVLQNLF